jgi:hypothetical protein
MAGYYLIIDDVPYNIFSIAWYSCGFLDSSETDFDTVADPDKAAIDSKATRSVGNRYLNT